MKFKYNRDKQLEITLEVGDSEIRCSFCGKKYKDIENNWEKMVYCFNKGKFNCSKKECVSSMAKLHFPLGERACMHPFIVQVKKEFNILSLLAFGFI